MGWWDVLHAAAAVMTVVAAIMVAVNVSARITAGGFIVFVFASIAWTVAGWFDGAPSLVIQNIILLLVNIAGVYRWLPRATVEANEQAKVGSV